MKIPKTLSELLQFIDSPLVLTEAYHPGKAFTHVYGPYQAYLEFWDKDSDKVFRYDFVPLIAFGKDDEEKIRNMFDMFVKIREASLELKGNPVIFWRLGEQHFQLDSIRLRTRIAIPGLDLTKLLSVIEDTL